MFAARSSPFRTHVQEVLWSARRDLFIATPYIKLSEAEWLCNQVSDTRFGNSLRLRILTDIRSINILTGSLDVAALRTCQTKIPHCEVINLPRLHAKVYIADEHCALVTSANLTPSGLDSNWEYGIAVTDPAAVRGIRQDLEQYASLGNPLSRGKIHQLETVANELRVEYEAVQRSQKAHLRQQFDAKLRAANVEFIRAQIGNKSAHGVFADAMMFLLTKRPMSTRELHLKLKQLLPELCDDSIDLVIDGRAFGKKWKHVVRNAQAYLRRAGKIELRGGRWTVLHTNNAESA